MSYCCILCRKTVPGLTVCCDTCRVRGLCQECYARATTDMRWHVMIPPDSELQRATSTIVWQVLKWMIPLVLCMGFCIRFLYATVIGKPPG